jgi:uncharacterized NAD-dependent epimerase/dehydratase family protein
VSATEGESALTERAQRQGVWALTGGPGRQARVREAVPAVRAVRSESDGGDQTKGKQTAAGDADRRARASGTRARSGTHGPGRSI